MKTQDIFKMIEEGGGNFSYYDIEDMEGVECVHSEHTNPRRDYLGEKLYYKNSEDEKIFYVEVLIANEGSEVYRYGEATAKQELTTVYTDIKPNL